MTDQVVAGGPGSRVIKCDSSVSVDGDIYASVGVMDRSYLFQPTVVPHEFTNRSLAWNDGQGYLAGVAPNVAEVAGVGTIGVVIDLYQNGLKIASTVSSSTGAWEFDGLNPAVAFDVVASYTGYESIIYNGVYPDDNKTLVISGSYSSTYADRGTYLSGVTISGGSGTYSSLSVTGLPSGLAATLEGDSIVISGNTSSTGAQSVSISVNSSDGQTATATKTFTIFAAPTVWSSTNKYSSVVLTNNGQTASFLSGGWCQAAFDGLAKTSGKWRFEVLWNSPADNYGMVGLVNPTTVSSYSSYFGQTGGDSIGWQDGYGLYYSGAFNSVINASSYNVNGSGRATMFFLDLDFGKAWVMTKTVTSGSDSAGTIVGGGDPTTGSSPMWTWTPNMPILPAVAMYIATFTISQAGSEYNTPVTGYNFWH
jgi:hypothetical protein